MTDLLFAVGLAVFFAATYLVVREEPVPQPMRVSRRDDRWR